jgi:COP9 signalosome complex subunit 6
MASKMDVDAPQGSVMASTSASGSVSVSLHPLVIMNISEHWTRVRAQEGKPTQGCSIFIFKLPYLSPLNGLILIIA